MTTHREQILTAVVAAISDGASSLVGGLDTAADWDAVLSIDDFGELRIYRSRVTPINRAESAAIVVEPVNDTAGQNTSLPTLDWSLTVRLAVIVRGDTPDSIADPIIESMHSSLMADLTLGGYAIDIQPQGVNFEMVEADQPAGVISCDYLVRYRTKVADLSLSP
jgi:hypothetical protein